MRLRDFLTTGLMALALVMFVGCQTSSAGGGSSASGQTDDDTDQQAEGDQTTDEGDADDDGGGGSDGDGDTDAEGDASDDGQDTPDDGDNDNADDNANDNEADTEPELTDEQEETVDDAVDATTTFLELFAALGSAELPSTGDGPIVITPSTGCPTVSIEQGAATVDFGDGCTPALYPDTTFAGSMTVQVNDDQTVTITFNDLAVDGETINGTAVASISEEGDLVIVEADVNVTITSGNQTFTYTGVITVEVNMVTGEVFIPTADLEATDESGDTYAIILTDVHSDPVNNVNFLPDSGTATIVMGTEGPGALTMEITFTENTPTDGTVLVSINGSPPITMSLEDVDDVEG